MKRMSQHRTGESLTGVLAQEPEHHLWVAVLARAVHDAFGQADYSEAQRAVSWLKGMSYDFREVCEMAGRNPGYVRTKLIKQLTERENYFNDLKKNYTHRNLS